MWNFAGSTGTEDRQFIVHVWITFQKATKQCCPWCVGICIFNWSFWSKLSQQFYFILLYCMGCRFCQMCLLVHVNNCLCTFLSRSLSISPPPLIINLAHWKSGCIWYIICRKDVWCTCSGYVWVWNSEIQVIARSSRELLLLSFKQW